MKTKDWVSLIEAGYSLEDNDEIWARNILDQTAPLLKRKTWPAFGKWRFTPTTVELEQIATDAPPFVVEYLNGIAKADEKSVDLMFRGGATVFSLHDHVFSQLPKEQVILTNKTLGKMRDIQSVRAFSGTGIGMGMALGFFKNPTPPTALEQKRWSLISSHWGAGLRLRVLCIFVRKYTLGQFYFGSV